MRYGSLLRLSLGLSFLSLLTGCGSASLTPQPSTSIPSVRADLSVQTSKITMTQAGFEPANITVKKGTTVTWKNTAKTSHWIASDPHPIHTDLTGFDAGRSIQSGESYQFTFTKVGTWGFHDHLRPVTFTGTVTVTE